MAPFIDATPPGSDDFSGRNTRRTGALIARSPSSHATDPASDDPRRHRPPAPPRAELPAAPHPGDLDRAGLARPVDPPRPVGVRLLRVPERLRRAVQHDLGDDRLHGGERRDPVDAGQPAPARQLRAHRRRDRAGRDDEGFVPALHGQGVPRRRRQPLRADPHRTQHHLRRRLAAPGGEPVPVGAARCRRERCPTTCCG